MSTDRLRRTDGALDGKGVLTGGTLTCGHCLEGHRHGHTGSMREGEYNRKGTEGGRALTHLTLSG